MQQNRSSLVETRQIGSLITRLLGHYWLPITGKTPAEQQAELLSRQQQIEDWLEDLAEFGPEIVSIACGEWRRQPGGKRPTPGDIRALAVRAEADRRSEDGTVADLREDKAERAARQRARDETMQRGGREIVTAWARRHGYETIEAYALAKGMHWSSAYRMVISEQLAGSPIGKALSGSAASLGVRAREFKPSPEKLAEDRRALGLETDNDGSGGSVA